jgi:hypothetical protein
MIDKIFKIGLLIAIMIFLVICFTATQKNRYEIVTQYEGSMGIFDNQLGVVYLLDLETDQWTVIKPFSRSRSI